MAATDPIPEQVDAVCVVGAGPHGLIIARALKSAGLAFTIIERGNDVGGLWDIDNPGTPMYDSCHYISSKNGSRYFDFPMPNHYPDYPSRRQIKAYISDFADTYDLRPLVEFGAEVMRAEADGDRWVVETSDGRIRSFNALIACPGSNWHPRMPDLPGHFDGELMHSQFYRSPDIFTGKRVLIIGLGNSGADIACDAARHADEVFVSVRRGYHFVPKHLFGVPTLDFLSDEEALRDRSKGLDLEGMIDVIVGDVTRLGYMKPDHKLLQTHPLLNTEILHHTSHGRITVKGDVKRLEGHQVRFIDDSVQDVDLVICATGYNYRVPFIDEERYGWVNGHPHLYMAAFCRQHPTLMVVGLIEAGGAPWKLDDQIAVIAANYLRDRRDNPERAAAFFDRVQHERADLQDGMEYVKSNRTVNYVNIPTLARELDRVLEETGYPKLSEGYYAGTKRASADAHGLEQILQH